MTASTPPDLRSLCHLPAVTLRDYVSRVSLLCELLHGPVVVNPVETPDTLPAQTEVPAAEEMSTGVAVPAPLPRPSMRPPTPGSVRACIYEVLGNAGVPMRRAEVAAAVARLRGVPLSEALTASVGETLRNPHDPRIRRVSQGVYAFVLA